jgi:hypothetical protein
VRYCGAAVAWGGERSGMGAGRRWPVGKCDCASYRLKTVSSSRSGSLCAKHRFRKGERTLGPPTSRLRAGVFSETPPPHASDDPAVVSRKDDRGSCSQALSSSLAPLHDRSMERSIPCGNMAPIINTGAREEELGPPWRGENLSS